VHALLLCREREKERKGERENPPRIPLARPLAGPPARSKRSMQFKAADQQPQSVVDQISDGEGVE
jgi:hypothetical protein